MQPASTATPSTAPIASANGPAAATRAVVILSALPGSATGSGVGTRPARAPGRNVLATVKRRVTTSRASAAPRRTATASQPYGEGDSCQNRRVKVCNLAVLTAAARAAPVRICDSTSSTAPGRDQFDDVGSGIEVEGHRPARARSEENPRTCLRKKWVRQAASRWRRLRVLRVQCVGAAVELAQHQPHQSVGQNG